MKTSVKTAVKTAGQSLLLGLLATLVVWVLYSLATIPRETLGDAQLSALKWANLHGLVGTLECSTERPPSGTHQGYYRCTLHRHLEDPAVAVWCRRGGCVEETTP